METGGRFSFRLMPPGMFDTVLVREKIAERNGWQYGWQQGKGKGLTVVLESRRTQRCQIGPSSG